MPSCNPVSYLQDSHKVRTPGISTTHSKRISFLSLYNTFRSSEHSKLCFEALETRFVPQNHLLRQLAESFKTPSEVGVLLDIKMDFIMNGKEKKEQNKGGRKPKANPSIHRYVFRLTDEENAKFLTFFEQSGMKVMAHFITACIFQKPIKTVKIDMDAVFSYEANQFLQPVQSRWRELQPNREDTLPQFLGEKGIGLPL